MSDGVLGNEVATAQGAIRRDVNIINTRGLHARAAAKFVRTAGRFQASVTVINRDVAVSGLSIMGLMMLAAGPGTTISIAATGRDAGDAVAALVELIESKFGEAD